MIDTSRQNILRRLLYLRNLEFFNIFWLPACLVVALASRNVLPCQPVACGMFLICAVLAQAVFYWRLKFQILSKTGCQRQAVGELSFSKGE